MNATNLITNNFNYWYHSTVNIGTNIHPMESPQIFITSQRSSDENTLFAHHNSSFLIPLGSGLGYVRRDWMCTYYTLHSQCTYVNTKLTLHYLFFEINRPQSCNLQWWRKYQLIVYSKFAYVQSCETVQNMPDFFTEICNTTNETWNFKFRLSIPQAYPGSLAWRQWVKNNESSLTFLETITPEPISKWSNRLLY